MDQLSFFQISGILYETFLLIFLFPLFDVPSIYLLFVDVNTFCKLICFLVLLFSTFCYIFRLLDIIFRFLYIYLHY